MTSDSLPASRLEQEEGVVSVKIMCKAERMKRTSFWSDEAGQDLVEYTLLLAMICLASAAAFLSGGASVSSIWNLTSNNLTSASSVAAS